MLNRLVLGVVAVMVTIVTRPAAATPFIDVTVLWEEALFGALPSGLSITCTGDASTNPPGAPAFGLGGIGCRDFLTVAHAVTSDETVSVSHSGGLLLTNTGATAFTGTLPFEVGFAFNPGGPEIGISIDNASQSASFSSSVGPDLFQTACSLPAAAFPGPVSSPSGSGYNFSELQCGLRIPDESFSGPGPVILSLLPGQSQDIVVHGISDFLAITDTFSGIPEPPVLDLFAPAVLSLGILYRRRAGRRPDGETAKLGFHVHPHMLRHATGYALANEGTDTRLIQDFLGHASIANTVRYTRLAPGRLAAVRVR